MIWVSVKERLPPFDVFVEVIYGRKSRMNNYFRGFCALHQGNEDEGVYWSKDGSDERTTGKFGITHWKYMNADLLGRTPILTITKKGDFAIKLKKL